MKNKILLLAKLFFPNTAEKMKAKEKILILAEEAGVWFVAVALFFFIFKMAEKFF
jgi:hypothetical protein